MTQSLSCPPCFLRGRVFGKARRRRPVGLCRSLRWPGRFRALCREGASLRAGRGKDVFCVRCSGAGLSGVVFEGKKRCGGRRVAEKRRSVRENGAVARKGPSLAGSGRGKRGSECPAGLCREGASLRAGRGKRGVRSRTERGPAAPESGEHGRVHYRLRDCPGRGKV